MSDDYHSDYNSVSRTMLNLFRQSRWEYYLTYIAKTLPPKAPTQAMLVGTVLHSVLLEDRELDDLVMCYPEDCLQSNGALNGKRAALFRDENPDRICFKACEYDPIADCVRAVRNHRQLRAVLDAATHKEQRFDAVLDGIECRCKPDISCDLDDYIVLYDLKCSLNVDPDSWRRLSRRCALWTQDAHYSRVMSQAFDKPVQFRFWNIEVKPPYRVMPYWFDPQGRAEAQMAHRRLLEQLVECQQSVMPPEVAWADGWDSLCVLEPWDFIETEQNDEVQI